jgi:hypothetical protein
MKRMTATKKEKSSMSLKLIKGYACLPMLMAMFLGFMVDVACATIETKNTPLPVKNELLQFRAGSHIIGFKPDKVYIVNTAGFLSVEFLGAHEVSPSAANEGTQQPETGGILMSGRGKNLANLKRVEYADLWDGISLRYDAVQDGISESTYFIQPGADVADIQLRYNTDTELQSDGSLKIKIPSQQGYITESKPVAWQVFDGKKQPVPVAYEIKNGTIGFKTGEYNKGYELIIDPTYQWHTFYGSASNDYANGIAVDGNGNVYVTGRGNATWGNPVHAYSGNFNIVVMKLTSSGGLVWHTFYGSDAYGQAIAVDGSGNVYVTGRSFSSWGNPVHAFSANPYQSNIVTMKLTNSGTLAWHTFHGSADGDFGFGIAVDTSNNVYVTGMSSNTWGTPVHTYSGDFDIVVLKLNSSGVLVWNTFHGSASTEYGFGIAVDASNNVYVTGDSNATWGDPINAYNDGTDIVVMKLNSSGALVWHSFYGSAYYDSGYGITVDGSGNIYITGVSDATWGSPVHACSGDSDIVAMKLNSSGALVWNTFHGSSSIDYGNSIAVDGSGNVYVTGVSDATWGSPMNVHNGAFDIVVVKLNGLGTLAWHTFYGSSSGDSGTGIANDNNGNFYVTGTSGSSWSSPLHALSGNSDITILKFKDDSSVPIPPPIPPPILKSKFLPAIYHLLLGNRI